MPVDGAGPDQDQQLRDSGYIKMAPWQARARALGISDAVAYAAWQKAVQGASNPNDMAEVSQAFEANLAKAGVGGSTSTVAPGTPGSSSGGSSGGGGSSGSGMTAAEERRMLLNAQAGFEQIVRTWGIQTTPELQSMIERAAKGKWSSAAFMSALRGTKEYKQQFPGIQWQKGMSEAAYNAQFRAYQGKAQDAGYRLGRKEFAVALKKGIDSTEWNLRVGAIRQIKANAPLFEEFRMELARRGIIKPNEKLSNKELYNLVTRRGSSQWTNIWNVSSVSAGLEGIGITVGRGEDLGRKELMQLLKVPVSQLNPGELVQIDYAQLASTAAKALPASRLYKMGVTKADLVKMALGGKDAAKIADRVNLAIGTAQATAEERRATPQMTVAGQQANTPTGRGVQATE